MDWCQRLDGFELDNQSLTDQQVQLALANDLTLVSDSDGHLATKWDGPAELFGTQGLLVDRLKKSRSERSMNLQRGPNDLMCPTIQFRIWLLRLLGGLGVMAFHPCFSPQGKYRCA